MCQYLPQALSVHTVKRLVEVIEVYVCVCVWGGGVFHSRNCSMMLRKVISGQQEEDQDNAANRYTIASAIGDCMVQNAGGSPKETVRDYSVSTHHVWERYAGHTDPRRSQIRNFWAFQKTLLGI